MKQNKFMAIKHQIGKARMAILLEKSEKIQKEQLKKLEQLLVRKAPSIN